MFGHTKNLTNLGGQLKLTREEHTYLYIRCSKELIWRVGKIV